MEFRGPAVILPRSGHRRSKRLHNRYRHRSHPLGPLVCNPGRWTSTTCLSCLAGSSVTHPMTSTSSSGWCARRAAPCVYQQHSSSLKLPLVQPRRRRRSSASRAKGPCPLARPFLFIDRPPAASSAGPHRRRRLPRNQRERLPHTQREPAAPRRRAQRCRPQRRRLAPKRPRLSSLRRARSKETACPTAIWIRRATTASMRRVRPRCSSR